MDEYASLSHTKWDCKYHVVFIPKCRRKVLYKNLRQHLGEVFHSLAQQRESQILEGHLLSDHVHILISIDRKSTRLNSSHLVISYAVFCLKKNSHAVWNWPRRRRLHRNRRTRSRHIAHRQPSRFFFYPWGPPPVPRSLPAGPFPF